MSTALHLAWKETSRGLGRYILFSLVVALVCALAVFVGALGDGLLGGFREYIDKLNADLIVYDDTARLLIPSSRIGSDKRSEIRRVQGIRDVGPIAFADVSVPKGSGGDALDVSLIGVEPGKPGEPPVVEGRGLMRKTANEAIIDYNLALAMALEPGDLLEIRSVQGNEEEYYTVKIVGVCDSRKYSLQPSVFVPIVAWDEIRPKAVQGSTQNDPTCNVVAVQLEDPTRIEQIRQALQIQVTGIEAVDRKTAYESAPGYQSIQSSLATQSAFALLIGMLVIGGFFQIQTLQKVPQIGMLKAIGTPNRTIALAAIIQILAVTLMGVAIGCLPAIGLAGLFPPDVPIVFEVRSVATAAFSILAMGLLGGLVSIRYALRVEPLIALGLSS